MKKENIDARWDFVTLPGFAYGRAGHEHRRVFEDIQTVRTLFPNHRNSETWPTSEIYYLIKDELMRYINA